jgi:hypothetical protein
LLPKYNALYQIEQASVRKFIKPSLTADLILLLSISPTKINLGQLFGDSRDQCQANDDQPFVQGQKMGIENRL